MTELHALSLINCCSVHRVHLDGRETPICVHLKREKQIRKLKRKQDMEAQRAQKNQMKTKHFKEKHNQSN